MLSSYTSFNTLFLSPFWFVAVLPVAVLVCRRFDHTPVIRMCQCGRKSPVKSTNKLESKTIKYLIFLLDK